MHRTAILFVALLLFAVIIPCQAAKRGLPEPTVPDCLGINIHFTGDDDKQVKMIADAGFKLVRMDFLWEWVEKEKGKYDFTAYDGLMAALDRYDIRPLFILDYGNPHYPNSTVPGDDVSRNAFAAFAGAAAAHFRDRGIIWEIWNEPNYRAFSPEVYAKLALAASKAIREADPTATVVGPALATMDMGFLDGILRNGSLKGLEAITVHPYRGNLPETTAADYVSARKLISRYSPNKEVPILSGEWGYTMISVTVEQQAQYLVRMFLSNLASDVNFSIWYDWSDDGLDPNYGEHHFGTVYNDLKPKLAYYAMQALSKQLKGYQFAHRISTQNPADHILVFKNGTRRKIAAWTTGDAHEISLPLDVSTVTLADMYGKRKPGKVAGNDLKLQVSQSVAYVDVLGSSKSLAIEEAWSVSAGTAVLSSARSLPVSYRLANPLNAPIKAVVIFKDSSGSKEIASYPIQVAPGKVAETARNLEMTWDGSGPLTAVVELKVDGEDGTILRTVQFDTTQFLTVTAAPPLSNVIPVYINNPSGQPFSGTVKVSTQEEASTAGTPIKLAKGQTFVEISCPVTPATPDKCMLYVDVLDDKGKAVYSPRCFTYKLAAPFDDASKVGVAMDGNGGVPVSSNQTTVAVPEPLPGVTSCVKIDYKFGNGWRYAKFNFNPLTPIENNPLYAGAWIYGNGSGDWVATRLRDTTNQCFQPGSPKLDYKGWRFVTWPLTPSRTAHWEGANDGVIHWPMRWDSQLMLDSNQKEHSDSIYVGPIWVVY